MGSLPLRLPLSVVPEGNDVGGKGSTIIPPITHSEVPSTFFLGTHHFSKKASPAKGYLSI
jgi:hypothetical protein